MSSSVTSPSDSQKLPPLALEILTLFEAHLRLQKKRSPHTRRVYIEWIHRFLEFRSIEVPNPRSAVELFEVSALRTFCQENFLALSAATQARNVSALRTFLRWGQKELNFDPAIERILERPKIPKKLVRVVDEEEIQQLHRALRSRPVEERLLFEILYGSGLRISEAADLRLQDVHENEAYALVLGKGSKRRQVPLSPQACELLRIRRSQKSSFEGIWSQRRDPRTLRSWVKSWELLILDATGDLHLHPHKLRHSLASHLLRRGAKLPQIQRLLGHSRLSTSERYTHIDIQDLMRVYDQSLPKLKD